MPTPYKLAFVLKEVSLTRHDLEYGIVKTCLDMYMYVYVVVFKLIIVLCMYGLCPCACVAYDLIKVMLFCCQNV